MSLGGNRFLGLRRPLLALVVVAVSAASLVLVPSVAAADDGGSVVLPPVSYTASACAGKTPIVVASDAAAQSDLYSAVTLAGVVGTDCVVLAGPRGESWPAGQRARLDAADADGYVVGGLAAVPDVKVAGLSLKRVAGADRWATARLVGAEARSLAGADDVDASASAGAEDPTTDCTGDVPIVVASDAAAQSDLYSAVTLAGVIGTDCIVLAGDRDVAMPAAQKARLDAGAEGGYVVGGLTAVPSAKLSGRDMTRLAGTDRWETAQFVGRLASGDTTVGSSTKDEADSSGMPVEQTGGVDEGFTSVTVGQQFSCGLRIDGTIDCWGSDWWRQVTDVPAGVFTAVDAGSGHACGLRRDGRIVCWGYNTSDTNRLQRDSRWSNRAPEGAFASLSVGGHYACGLRANGTLECWGDDDWKHYRGVRGHRIDPPDGTYVAVSVGSGFACGIQTGGGVSCWGGRSSMPGGGALELPPSGEFSSVSAGWRFACGLRPNGSVECWGYKGYNDQSVGNPIGQFAKVAAAGGGACGTKTDGSVECWRSERSTTPFFMLNPPAGRFVEVDTRAGHACALHQSARIECWGLNDTYQSTPQVRVNPSLGFQSLWLKEGFPCGSRGDGTVACWGNFFNNQGWTLAHMYESVGVSVVPGVSGVKDLVYPSSHFTDQLDEDRRTPSLLERAWVVVHHFDGSVRLLSSEGQYWDDAADEWRQYPALKVEIAGSFVKSEGNCGLRTDGVVVCWNRLGSIIEQWPGTYKDLSGVCGVREEGSIACPGLESPYWNDWAKVRAFTGTLHWEEIPSGTFLTVESSLTRACGIQSNSSVACWGQWTYEDYNPRQYGRGTWVERDAKTKTPSGKFAKLALSDGARACGIRTNGTLACWGDWGYWGGPRGDEWTQMKPPAGKFIDVALFDRWGCGVTTKTEVVCWGSDFRWQASPPPVH